jgi:uncharacterized protein (DUF1778 family)
MQTEARTAPINIRARQTQRELIDRAAAAQRKSRSDFILEAACKEAENVLLDQRLFLYWMRDNLLNLLLSCGRAWPETGSSKRCFPVRHRGKSNRAGAADRQP